MVAIALAQAKASGDAVKGLEPPRPAEELGEARAALAPSRAGPVGPSGRGWHLPRHRSGAGRLRPGPCPGRLDERPSGRPSTALAGESAGRPPKSPPPLAAQLADAERALAGSRRPEVARLEAAIYEARQDVEGLVASQDSEAARWWLLAERGHAAGRAAERFAAGLAGYREGLDGEKSHPPEACSGPATRHHGRRQLHLQPPVGRGYGPDFVVTPGC